MSMNKYIIAGSLVFFSYILRAQIGINTLTPDASAALDIQPSSTQSASGILIPRLSQSQRTNMTTPAKGLMVFDITDNLFYVNLNAGSPNWYAVDPWQTKASSATSTVNVMYTHTTVTNVGIGTTNPTVRLDVNGSITSNSVVTTQTLAATSVTVPGFAANAFVPTGLISMFSGTLVPTGWGLCDGTIQGGIQTPDLRGRFVIGFDTYSPPPLDMGTSRAVVLPSLTASVTPAVAPNDGITKNYGQLGNTGGEIGHLLSAGESGLPVHDHTAQPHSHNTNGVYSTTGTGNAAYSYAGTSCCTNYPQGMSSTTVDVDLSIAQNASVVHENRPPYYVLAYIIKLP
jgi:microcystin-dependent protein